MKYLVDKQRKIFSNEQNQPNSRQIFFFLAAISLMTLMIYWPVHSYDFIDYDDQLYVTDNHNVQKGLTLQSIRWALTDLTAFWSPVTWLSHMLDVELFGMNPGAHHFTNVLFHLINTWVLFLIFFKISREFIKSAFIAGTFALHPIHIESVAWISERKDVLSALFFLLTIWIYLKYIENPKKLTYTTLCLVYLFGLMSKSMIVTLPFVLILLDFWPLRRFGDDLGCQQLFSKKILPVLSKLITEKTLLFFLSIIFCFITYYAQNIYGSVKVLNSLSIALRISNLFVSYIKYIGKLICPTDMAVFYPYYSSITWWQLTGSIMMFLFISFIAIFLIKQKPWILVGWLWYIGTLFPVIGLIQVGSQAMADRYLYIPSIGISIIFAWMIFEIDFSKFFKMISMILIFVLYMIISFSQIEHWQNTQTLFQHAANVTENNYVAYKNLGSYFYKHGELDKAFINFNRAMKIRKNDADVYNNLGVIFIRIGKNEKAITNLSKSIALRPGFSPAHNNLGAAYEFQGNKDMALKHYAKALDIDPHFKEAKNNLDRITKNSSEQKPACNVIPD